jgi:hypothetical protein
MRHLSHTLTTLPYFVPTDLVSPLKRKSCIRPPSDGTFVLPIRQSLIKDARMSPGTTRMIVLLAGWSGGGRPLETTLGIIGKHLGRSARQVQRYLRDAAEEGYLYFKKVVNRLGYIIGLRIVLCKAAVYAPQRPKKKPPTVENPPVHRGNPATTDAADTNKNKYIFLEADDPLDRKLASLGSAMGIPIQPD